MKMNYKFSKLETNEIREKRKIRKYVISEDLDNFGYSTEIKFQGPFGGESRMEGPSVRVETINNHYVLEFFNYYPSHGNTIRGIFGVEDTSTKKEKIKELSLEKLVSKIKEKHKNKGSEKYRIFYNFNKDNQKPK